MTVDLNLSSEQRQIVEALNKVLADQFPAARLRGPHEKSPDGALMPLLAELGGFGLGSAEAIGGTGFGIVEETLAFTEFGRHLVTPNALASTIAGRLAARLGMNDAASEIISGLRLVSIANALRSFDFDDVSDLDIHLFDAAEARLALLWNETGMLLIDCARLAKRAEQSIDRSVTLHRSTLTEADVIGRVAACDTTLIRQAHLLMAAQFLGICEAVCAMACDYAKVRVQFGQPIGSFQAVKHRCADMLISARALGAQVAFAALSEQSNASNAALQVDACRLLGARYALASSRSNIQVHGAIGFTAECDAHLYLLRSHLYENIAASRAVSNRLLMAHPFGSGAAHGAKRA